MTDNLKAGHGFALIFEAASAQNFLREGIAGLRASHAADNSYETTLTVLSLGLQKVIKLSLGLIGVRDHGYWPDPASMMTSSADIYQGYANLAKYASDKQTQHHIPDYDGARFSNFDADPVWPLIVECLAYYESIAGFQHIDFLSEEDDEVRTRPNAYWRIQGIVLGSNLEHSDSIAAPFLPISGKDKERVNRAIADRVETWWSTLYDLWAEGLFGTRGQEMSFFMRPST